MTPLDNRNASFVLRIWWEEADAKPGGRRLWRARVQHVRSGEATYVQDLEGLLGFIERWAGRLATRERSTDRRAAPPSDVSDAMRDG